MTEGILVERPEFPRWRTPYSTTFNHYNEILEWKKKEDAWVEKLEGEWDELKIDLENAKAQAKERYSWAKELEGENIELRDKLEAILKVIEPYKDKIPNTINIDIRKILEAEG